MSGTAGTGSRQEPIPTWQSGCCQSFAPCGWRWCWLSSGSAGPGLKPGLCNFSNESAVPCQTLSVFIYQSSSFSSSLWSKRGYRKKAPKCSFLNQAARQNGSTALQGLRLSLTCILVSFPNAGKAKYYYKSTFTKQRQGWTSMPAVYNYLLES